MYASNVLAVSGALIAAVAAVPMAGERHHQHHQREIVWETATDEVIVTIPVTKTVWIEPGETPPTEASPQGYGASSSTPAAEPAAYTPSSPAAPAYTPPASSSSVYVAPPAYTPPASSSSVYVAPPAYTPPTTTSTSVYVAPTPSSTYVAPASYAAPSSSAAPSASSYGGSSSGLSYGMGKAGTSYTGDLTYFTPGLGACGQYSGEQDHMVAISEKIFDSYNSGGNSNNNPLCGATVNIKGADGNTYPATIWDRCPGCDTGCLDLPQAFFDTVTLHPDPNDNNKMIPADGRAKNVEWSFA